MGRCWFTPLAGPICSNCIIPSCSLIKLSMDRRADALMSSLWRSRRPTPLCPRAGRGRAGRVRMPGEPSRKPSPRPDRTARPCAFVRSRYQRLAGPSCMRSPGFPSPVQPHARHLPAIKAAAVSPWSRARAPPTAELLPNARDGPVVALPNPRSSI
jgi:hypothetical protein